jgi:hypothetical protein
LSNPPLIKPQIFFSHDERAENWQRYEITISKKFAEFFDSLFRNINIQIVMNISDFSFRIHHPKNNFAIILINFEEVFLPIGFMQ